jgi:hypothetical protein
MSKAVAVTLANFNRDNKALPIAPVPTKPIFSMWTSSILNSLVVRQNRLHLSVISFLSVMQGWRSIQQQLSGAAGGIG